MKKVIGFLLGAALTAFIVKTAVPYFSAEEEAGMNAGLAAGAKRISTENTRGLSPAE